MIIYQHLPPLKKIPWILEGNLWYRNMLYELKKQQIVRLYNCKRRSVNKFSSLSKTRWRVSTIIILHLFFERSFCDYAIMNDKRVVPNWLPVFFSWSCSRGKNSYYSFNWTLGQERANITSLWPGHWVGAQVTPRWLFFFAKWYVLEKKNEMQLNSWSDIISWLY